MGERRWHGPGRPAIAAILSTAFPGLGQAWLGARRRGLLIAAPLLAGFAVLGVSLAIDARAVLGPLLRPEVILVLLVLIVAVGVYHLLAVRDAFRLGARRGLRAEDGLPPPEPRRRAALPSPYLVVALAAVVAFYGTAEFVGVRAYQAAVAIFGGPGFEIPTASFSPRPSPSGTPTPVSAAPVTAPPPSPTPVPVPPWAADGRLNLLLIGSDAGPGRWLARTDTMVVLSVDVATSRAALFGIPRNIVNVPLPPESAGAFANGRYPAFLNSLYVYALGHPEHFPGGEGAGFRAVTGAIQELVGMPLDGAIVVNLNGFVDLVDAVGGLWIDVPQSLYDARYPLPDGSGYIEIYIKAGCQKLTGDRALQYARSRHQDDDYGRMRRQQTVLLAIARQLDPISLLPRVPELLEIARDNLWTTIEPNEIANLAVLAARVDTGDIETIRFSPPTYPEYLDTKAIEAIRERAATVFDDPAASPSPTPARTPRPCPRD